MTVPSIALITEVAAGFYGVERAELLSSRRTAGTIRPRHVAMYLAKRMTPHTFAEIGMHVGGRDHTTVMHAARKIETAMADDPELADEVLACEAAVIAATGLVPVVPPDRDPAAIADAILDGGRRIVEVSLDDLRTLAAAVRRSAAGAAAIKEPPPASRGAAEAAAISAARALVGAVRRTAQAGFDAPARAKARALQANAYAALCAAVDALPPEEDESHVRHG